MAKKVVRKLIGSLPADILFEIVKTCASLPEIKEEVTKNHDNNRWWPKNVKDWRLRMVIAGWSTRISYSMITTYQKVVAEICEIGYDNLCSLSDNEIHRIIGSLGLFNTRINYLRSLEDFIGKYEIDDLKLSKLSNDTIIKNFAENVSGASYKVAQCAILYAKGYHCGIFPIDSGMKDLLGPCIGLSLPSGPIAHEIMRKHLENEISKDSSEYYRLSQNEGFIDLEIPKNNPPLWWAHLVLIYFKRLYCNKQNPQSCPLRLNPKVKKYIGHMCDKKSPQSGGIRYIILEGVDKVGKTTLAKLLEKKMGYNIVHSSYEPCRKQIVQHYKGLFDEFSVPTVFDRSFISEITYGNAIRNHSRISPLEFQQLLKFISEKNCIVLYLKEKKDIVEGRIEPDEIGNNEIPGALDKLIAEYDNCMNEVREFLPVYELTPSNTPINQMLGLISKLIN